MIVLVLRTTAQKLKISIKDFFGKCDQIRKKLRICSHLLKKSLMESFIFCAVQWSTASCKIQESRIKMTSLRRTHTMREKCSYSEFFWSVFSDNRTEYSKILRISPYSIRMQENKDQKKCKYGHFLHSSKQQTHVFLNETFTCWCRINKQLTASHGKGGEFCKSIFQ